MRKSSATTFLLRPAVLLILATLLCGTSILRAAADSVWTIPSFYRSNNDVSAFISSSNGDSVSLAYSAEVRTRDEAITTTHIQVRNWNATTGKALVSRDYFNVQMADAQPIYRFGTLHGIPHFLYCPQVKTLNLVNVLSGAVQVDFSVEDTIRSVYMSPDFSHSVICTKNDLFYVVDLEHKQIMLRDSVWPSYTYVRPPDTLHGLADSSYFLAHFKIFCNSNSWTSDNSLVMLRVDRLSDTLGTDIEYRAESYWHAFDLQSKSYVSDTIPTHQYGTWIPDSKVFCTFGNHTFYYTDIHGAQKTITNPHLLIDYAVNSADSLVTLVSPDFYFDFWNLNNTLIRSFSPGDMIAYTFSSDSRFLAYLTPDNTLTVINTKTFQGIYQIHLDFPPNVNYNDHSSMKFLSGNRAILVLDSSWNYRIVDLATAQSVASVSLESYYTTSPDGTSLFILNNKLYRYNLFTGDLVKAFPDDELYDRLRSIAISPDGDHLLTADHALRYWDVPSTTQLNTREFPTAQTIKWSPLDSIAVILNLSVDSTQKWVSLLNTSQLSTIHEYDSNSVFMSFSPDSSSFVLADSKGNVFRYDLSSGMLLDSLHMQYLVSAAIWNPLSQNYYLGDVKGDIWSVSSNHDTIVKVYHTVYPLRELVLSPNGTYLSYISTKDNALLQLSNGKVMSTLSTAPFGTLFSEVDSTCTFVYNGSFIRENTRTATITQHNTKNRAFFRPQKNYYVVGSSDARDSLSLFSTNSDKIASWLVRTPVYDLLMWNGNADRIALLDIFNNVVVWKPSNLLEGEGVYHPSDVAESPSPSSCVVYPLPAASDFHVRLANESNRCVSATAYSLVGLGTELSQLSDGGFSVSTLPNGMYTIMLRMSNGVQQAVRIVVTHGS